MKEVTPQGHNSRVAAAFEYKHLLERTRQRVKLGDIIKIDRRKGKVVALYEDFAVLVFSVSSPIWEFKRDQYRECFRWAEIAGLL